MVILGIFVTLNVHKINVVIKINKKKIVLKLIFSFCFVV